MQKTCPVYGTIYKLKSERHITESMGNAYLKAKECYSVMNRNKQQCVVKPKIHSSTENRSISNPKLRAGSANSKTRMTVMPNMQIQSQLRHRGQSKTPKTQLRTSQAKQVFLLSQTPQS